MAGGDLTEFPKGSRAYCVVSTKGDTKPCRALGAVTVGTAFDKRQGVVAWTLINMRSGKHSRTFYGVRGGKFSQKGLAFNVCPFCGVELQRKAVAVKKKANA